MCGTAPRRGDVAADPVSTGLAPKLCLPPRLVPGTAGTGGLGMPLLPACAVGAGDGRGGLLGVGGSSLSSPPASVSLEAEASAAAALSVALTRRCRRWSARRCRGRVRVCGCVGVEEGGVLSPGLGPPPVAVPVPGPWRGPGMGLGVGVGLADGGGGDAPASTNLQDGQIQYAGHGHNGHYRQDPWCEDEEEGEGQARETTKRAIWCVCAWGGERETERE